MAAWSVNELARFLEERDLAGLAKHLAAQGVNGSDFAALTFDEFVGDVRVTPFAAKKLVATREAFLNNV